MVNSRFRKSGRNVSSVSDVFGVLIVLAIACLVVVAIFWGAFKKVALGFGYGEDTPKQGLVHYITELYPDAKDIRVVCPKLDSDGDGYVRCTGVFNNAGKSERVIAECVTALTMNDGCAAPRNLIQSNQSE